MTTSYLYPTYTIICKVPQLSSEFQNTDSTKDQGGFPMPHKEGHLLVQLKSEVYIHLSQIHLISVSQFLTFNPSKKFPVLGQLGSPLYFKNVKCQNNSRENYFFQLLFLSSHSQWVRSLHTYTQLVFGSIAFK